MSSLKHLTFIAIFFLCLICSCSKEYKQNTLKNDSYIVNSYKILNPATVPNAVEIRVIKLFKDFSYERLIVECISADSADMEFLSPHTIYIEFFYGKAKVDSTITYDLKERNDVIEFEAFRVY